MARNSNLEVSERVSRNIRNRRQALQWSVHKLSMELHDHRCPVHTSGYDMSPAVITAIEIGVPSQHGYPQRTRPVSVDELVALGEVLKVTPTALLFGE